MISLLFGRVRSANVDRIVLEVGGVGFSILVTPITAATLTVGSEAQVFTALVVREDSLTLFGFLDEQSRTVFELVQTVSGIGPKVAMSMVAVLSPDDLARAITQEDVAAIERVPGIGRKGAQRLILELKGKLPSLATFGKLISHLPLWREQLSSALIGLGFSSKEADNAISQMVTEMRESDEDPESVPLGDLLKRALAGGRRG